MKTSVGFKSVVFSGIVAGIVFLMAEMLMLAMTGQSPFGPPRMMAAMVMGREVLPPPATFEMGIMMAAMMVHLIISVIAAAVFGIIYKMFSRSLMIALILGAVYGLGFYFFAFYIMTGIWPWFEMARGTISIIGHILFGLALGATFHKLSGVTAEA